MTRVDLLSNPMTTAADIIKGGTSGVPERLAIGSEGEVLTVTSGVPSWEPAAGGANADLALPIDAAAKTDEGSGDLFPGTSLDGGWSSFNSSALTSIDRSVAGAVILKNTGNTSAAGRGIKRAFAPAGDFTVYGKCLHYTARTANQWTGIAVGPSDMTDGASGHRLELNILWTSALNIKFQKVDAGVETAVFTQAVAGSTFFLGNDVNPNPIWLRIKRVGSTLTAGVSWDGVQFIEHATTTTIAFTVANVALLMAEGTATNDIRATWRYIATTG